MNERIAKWLSGVTMVLVLPILLRADNSTAPERIVYSKPANVTQNTRVKVTRVRGESLKGIPDGFEMYILCPDHTGLTVQEHPSIFWFMNKPVKNVKLKISVLSDTDPEPLLERIQEADQDGGVQRVDLKDAAKSLEPGTEYKVQVSIIVDEKEGSKNPLTSGSIKRIAASDKLVSKLLTRPTPAERAIVYARQGIWYDALTAVSDQIAAEPASKTLHDERADLLTQSDLAEAAAFDRSLGGK